MPSGRLKTGEAAKREKFMEEMFLKNPSLTAAKANDELMRQFGSRMRSNAVYAIRSRVRAMQKLPTLVQTPEAGPVTPTLEVSFQEQPRGRRAYEEVTEKEASAFLVTGSPKQVRFLNDTLESLRAKGLSDLKVDHVADSYVVITKG